MITARSVIITLRAALQCDHRLLVGHEILLADGLDDLLQLLVRERLRVQ